MATKTAGKRRRSTGRIADGTPEPVSVDQARDEIMRHFTAKTDSHSILCRMRRVFRKLGDLDVQTLDQLDDAAVQRYERSIPETMLRECRLNMLRDLRAVCHVAVKLNLLASMPQIPWLRDKEPGRSGIIAATSRDDVMRLLASLQPEPTDPWDKWRLHALVATVVYTGLLRDDILDLLVADVDLAKGVILIRRRKGNKRSDLPRPLAIHPDLKGILSEWLLQTGGVYVFPGKRKVGRWHGSGSKKLRAFEEISIAARAAGIKEVVNFKTLRLFHFEAVESIEGLGSLIPRAKPGLKPRPAATIGEPWEPVSIRGKPKGVLNRAEHKVISVLVQAFPKGLSMQEMEKLTGLGGWRVALGRLRDDPDWKRELYRPRDTFEGKKSNFYRIGRW